MKKIIPLFIISVFVLSSCTIDWNDVNVNKIGELEKQVAEAQERKGNDLLIKKQECAKQYDTIMKQEKDIYPEDESISIDSIFYSPGENSCLYAMTLSKEANLQGKTDLWTWLIVKDAYTKDILYSSKLIQLNKDGTDFYNVKKTEYEEKIKELKGE